MARVSPPKPHRWLDDPDAYFYGTLLQSAPFLQDDARIAVWGDIFTAVLSDIQDNEGERTGSTLRTDATLRATAIRRFNIITGD